MCRCVMPVHATACPATSGSPAAMAQCVPTAKGGRHRKGGSHSRAEIWVSAPGHFTAQRGLLALSAMTGPLKQPGMEAKQWWQWAVYIPDLSWLCRWTKSWLQPKVTPQELCFINENYIKLPPLVVPPILHHISEPWVSGKSKTKAHWEKKKNGLGEASQLVGLKESYAQENIVSFSKIPWKRPGLY